LPETPCGQQTSLHLTFMKSICGRDGHMKGCTYTFSSV